MRFKNPFRNPAQSRFCREELDHFIELHGETEAVAAVAAALDKAALPPDPAAPRREAWENFAVAKGVTLNETGARVWPAEMTVASANAMKNFLHGLAVANPGVVVVYNLNLPGTNAKLVFNGEEVREHGSHGENFAWVQIRPGQWVHPSVLVVSDFERPRAMPRLPESAMQPRR